MRRVMSWTLLFLLVALLFPVTVGAQGAAVEMEAEALYEGTSKYGEWLPVLVNLENDGEDVRGQVQASLSGTGGQTVYAQHVELPRGARKQVTIYVLPNNFSRRVTVAFVPDGESEPTVGQEVEIRPVPNIRFITGAIAPDGSGLETLTGVNFRGERQSGGEALLLPLTLDTLPDRPEALRTLDLLVMSGVDTSALTPSQRAALEQYVSQGGILLLGGGPEAARVAAGIPDTLLPVTIEGEMALDTLPVLEEITGEPVRVNGPFPVATGAAVGNAVTRYNQDDIPLVVEREVGKGVVYWMALDPSLSPFDAWAGTDEFWLALMGQRTAYPLDMPPDVSPRRMADQQLVYALQSLPSLDLPSLRLLVPLLAAYILIVGPLNYFALRRQRRLELAWVTIPVITILFSVGAYGLGFQLRGNDVIVNQVAIVQGVPGSEGGYARSMIGVFSPARRDYDLAVQGTALLAPAPTDGSFMGSTSSEGSVLVQGEPALVENLTVNQWSMQSVMAEALLSEGYAFETDLETANEEITGTITNQSGRPWEDVTLVLGGSFERLGDFAPGERKEVSLTMQDVDPRMGPDVAWRIFENQFGPTGPSREVQARQQILSSLYNAPSGATSLASARVPVLLAWSEEAPVEVTLAEGARASQLATTLFYSELPVSFGAGEISVPRGMLATQIVKNDGSTCYGPGVASLAPDFSEAEIQFELPGPLKELDPSLLMLYVSSDGGWFAAPAMALYDFTEEEWVEVVDPILGRNRLENPDALVSSNGLIRVRLQNLDRNRGGCIFLDAALDGELRAAPQAKVEG